MGKGEYSNVQHKTFNFGEKIKKRDRFTINRMRALILGNAINILLTTSEINMWITSIEHLVNNHCQK